MSHQEMLNEDGVLGGQINRALQTLSFAKQRFDSYASPQAKYVVLLLPIAILLASQATDPRKDIKMRERCVHALKRMTAEQVVLAGLSADFSAEVLRFVRQHDVRNHDIANTGWEKSSFKTRIKQLFVDSMIFKGDASSAKEPFSEQTFTEMAIRNAKSAGSLAFGGHVHTIWGPMAGEECKSIVASMKSVAEATLDRIEADMHPKDLDMSFSCFDLKVWKAAKEHLDSGQVEKWNSFELCMKSRVRALCRAFGLDPVLGEKELTPTALDLLDDQSGLAQSIKEMDNRPMWSRVLGSDKLSVLPDLVCIYMSVLDGECGVERDLASLKAGECSRSQLDVT